MKLLSMKRRERIVEVIFGASLFMLLFCLVFLLFAYQDFRALSLQAGWNHDGISSALQEHWVDEGMRNGVFSGVFSRMNWWPWHPICRWLGLHGYSWSVRLQLFIVLGSTIVLWVITFFSGLVVKIFVQKIIEKKEGFQIVG